MTKYSVIRQVTARAARKAVAITRQSQSLRHVDEVRLYYVKLDLIPPTLHMSLEFHGHTPQVII